MTNTNSDSPNMVYFAMRSTLDGKGHIGSALVVDARGIPLEFRCSVPVRPSAAQTALYGTPIRDYIAFNLCGQPLLESLTRNPRICLVESEPDLNLQEYVSIPVIYVCRTESNGESERGIRGNGGRVQYRQLVQSRQLDEHDEGPDGQLQNEVEEERISLDSPANFEPVILRSHPDWKQSLKDFLPDLRGLFGSIDLVEPFSRITAGCRLLCQEDERFK